MEMDLEQKMETDMCNCRLMNGILKNDIITFDSKLGTIIEINHPLIKIEELYLESKINEIKLN
jgi:hypothetical protein